MCGILKFRVMCCFVVVLSQTYPNRCVCVCVCECWSKKCDCADIVCYGLIVGCGTSYEELCEYIDGLNNSYLRGMCMCVL